MDAIIKDEEDLKCVLRVIARLMQSDPAIDTMEGVALNFLVRECIIYENKICSFPPQDIPEYDYEIKLMSNDIKVKNEQNNM